MRLLFPRSVPSFLLWLALCLTLGAAQNKTTSRSSDAWMSRMPGERHVYKTVQGRPLYLWVVKPSGWQATDTRPAIVFFHGGAWVGGNPGQFSEQAKYLAGRGTVAVLVQYRLLDRASQDPPLICVHDAKSAIRWVRGHAKQLGIDPNRIAAAGGSAGGHLAAFVGMVEGLDDPHDDKTISPKANALVLFNPVFDNGPTGWGFARVGSRYREFSPRHNISADDPPTIVFLGTNDRLIPVDTVKAFQKEMQDAGVRCEAYFYEGQPHGFFNYGRAGNKYYLLTMRRADEFLASLGWLSGPPTLPLPSGESQETK